MARLLPSSLELRNPDYSDWRELHRLEEEMLSHAAEEYRARYEGTIVGEEISWPRADGYARYMIVKESPLTLQHIATGDAWRVEPALIRGLRLIDAIEMVRGKRAFEAIFGVSNHPPINR